MSCSKASDGCAIRCYQLSYFSPTKIEKVPPESYLCEVIMT